jgi:acetylornithine deacetylase/succinyl-diaminopimelate desuccinylase-like protein
VEGTWRWQPERSAREVHAELESLAVQVAARFDVRAEVTLAPWREGYRLSPDEQVVRSLCDAYRTVTGRDLPLGGSTLAGDAPIFIRQRQVAAISHGLDARTAQTANESVAVDDLVRLARVYICLALDYLSASRARRESAADDYSRPAVVAPVPDRMSQRVALQGAGAIE